MCGTSPVMRARRVFHSPFFQCFCPVAVDAAVAGAAGRVHVRQALAVDAADAAALEVVDHHLIGLALLVAAQEQPAVAAEVGVDLERHLEVPVPAVGEQDAAVAGTVLGGRQDAVMDGPALAVAVVVHLADVPARQVLAVEERGEARRHGGRGCHRGEYGEAGEGDRALQLHHGTPSRFLAPSIERAAGLSGGRRLRPGTRPAWHWWRDSRRRSRPSPAAAADGCRRRGTRRWASTAAARAARPRARATAARRARRPAGSTAASAAQPAA